MNSTKIDFDKMHSHIGFVIKHLLVTNVHGKFTDYESSLVSTDGTPEGVTGKVVLKAASIDTGVGMRDDHLRSPDFFQAEEYPELVYTVNKVTLISDAQYSVEGTLQIRDVTKPLTLRATIEGRLPNQDSEMVSVSVTGEFLRQDFGLTWSGLMGSVPAVADKVKLQIDVALIATPVLEEALV